MKTTVNIIVKFRNSCEETLMISGAYAQGCKVQFLGGGTWKISAVPVEDAEEMRQVCRYYNEVPK